MAFNVRPLLLASALLALPVKVQAGLRTPPQPGRSWHLGAGTHGWNGDVYENDGDTWGDGRPEPPGTDSQSATGKTVAVDAAYGLQAAWDYFRRVHHRDGFDGKGTATFIRTHYRQQFLGPDNAAWIDSCNCISVADPKNEYPMVDLNTLAHEFTHGVTQYSADFKSGGEPGGLNEATSDFFAAMAETYTRHGRGGSLIGDAGTDWAVRAQGLPAAPGGRPQEKVMRWLDKPARKRGGQDAWTPELADKEVHLASGPLSRALYFLCRGADPLPAAGTEPGDHCSPFLPGGMEPIGNDKTARIWYRALTTYLTPESDYMAAREAALNAARDLYPGGPEAAAVARAFAAINRGGPDPGPDREPLPAIEALAHVSGSSLALDLRPVPEGSTGLDAVDQVEYYVDNALLVAKGSTFPVSLDVSRLLANGPHQLTVWAYGRNGQVAVAKATPFQLAMPVQQILADPGLEGGTGAWRGDAKAVLATDWTGVNPHGGFGYAAFDRAGGRQNLELVQKVAIPADARTVKLSLWTWIRSDLRGGAARDTLTLSVQELAAGSSRRPLAVFTNLDAREAWRLARVDLSPWAGRTVELSLRSDIAPGTGTAFRVDDIRLVCSRYPRVPQVAIDPERQDLFAGCGTVRPLQVLVTGTSRTGVEWSLPTGGALDPETLRYTAPAESGSYRVRARCNEDPGAVGETWFRVMPPVGLRPATLVLDPGAAAPVELMLAPGVAADVAVREGSPQGGTLRRAGNAVQYTAPDAPGSYHLDAVEQGGAARRGTVLVKVVPRVRVTLDPPAATLRPWKGQQFKAEVEGADDPGVDWAVQETDGFLLRDGWFAGLKPGIYHLQATSRANPSATATATVTVGAPLHETGRREGL